MADSFKLDASPCELADVAGFRTGCASCGLKSAGADVGVILSEGEAGTAVFTRNEVAAAPVKLSRPRAATGGLRGVVVNSGNANCCTGDAGLSDAAEMGRIAAEKLGVAQDKVLVASTGVIGRPLDMEKVRRGVEGAASDALSSGRGDLASAIMTTDTVRKIASASGTLDGHAFRVAGAAKGAGMIAPNMATMLAFIVTDVAVTPGLLREILPTVAERTFNRVTVDGDTSTNDTLCLLSSGKAGNAALSNRFAQGSVILAGAVEAVARELAMAIAADGEGASRLIDVRVVGAATDAEALRAASAIAGSLLVKTAVCGADPNWGRILAAAGRSGARVDESCATVRLAGVVVFDRGRPVRPEPSDLADKMRLKRIEILLNLGIGAGDAAMWTCDLTQRYIEINAHYHT